MYLIASPVLSAVAHLWDLLNDRAHPRQTAQQFGTLSGMERTMKQQRHDGREIIQRQMSKGIHMEGAHMKASGIRSHQLCLGTRCVQQCAQGSTCV